MGNNSRSGVRSIRLYSICNPTNGVQPRSSASVFARAPQRPRLHRYATAAPHARGGAASPEVVFETMKCNGGAPVALSAVSDALYLRPLILGLLRVTGDEKAAKGDLPPDAPFKLTPAPADLEGFRDSFKDSLAFGAHVRGIAASGMPGHFAHGD